ncbi:MAG: hypothetical protein EOM10_15985 [Opitutae bacterium]|nr:hypothetical protein [Opitutae bacterium]
MNAMLENIEKIDTSLIALGHLADIDDELELPTVQHMIDLLQSDMSDRLEEVFQAARKWREEQAEEAQARQEARRLAVRLEAAQTTLERVTNEVLAASSKNQDREIGQHIARAACEIGAAMRVLRGQDEVVELRIGRA